jgi:uncharacterized protein (UPF0332 family)
MNPNEFLATADRLAQGGTEGDWRSAISRAYYSVFHEFRSFFLTQGLDLGRGGQCHFNLYAGLFNCGIPSVAPLGSRVDDLRVNRVTADYDLAGTILSETQSSRQHLAARSAGQRRAAGFGLNFLAQAASALARAG